MGKCRNHPEATKVCLCSDLMQTLVNSAYILKTLDCIGMDPKAATKLIVKFFYGKLDENSGKIFGWKEQHFHNGDLTFATSIHAKSNLRNDFRRRRLSIYSILSKENAKLQNDNRVPREHGHTSILSNTFHVKTCP